MTTDPHKGACEDSARAQRQEQGQSDDDRLHRGAQECRNGGLEDPEETCARELVREVWRRAQESVFPDAVVSFVIQKLAAWEVANSQRDSELASDAEPFQKVAEEGPEPSGAESVAIDISGLSESQRVILDDLLQAWTGKRYITASTGHQEQVPPPIAGIRADPKGQQDSELAEGGVPLKDFLKARSDDHSLPSFEVKMDCGPWLNSNTDAPSRPVAWSYVGPPSSLTRRYSVRYQVTPSLFDAVKAVPGVEYVALERYKVLVRCGDLFDFDRDGIHEKILEIMRGRYASQEGSGE
jgi:hypothetical protein